MSDLVLSPGHRATVFPQESSPLMVSQQISTDSSQFMAGQCFVVRVTFAGSVPSFRQMAVSPIELTEGDVLDSFGNLKKCDAIWTDPEPTQCVSGKLVAGNVLTFTECGIDASTEPRYFVLFANHETSILSVDIVNQHDIITANPSSAMTTTTGQTLSFSMDLTDVYGPDGLMLSSFMEHSSDCELAVSVCDQFSGQCSLFEVIDEDEHWESKHCFNVGAMDQVMATNIGKGPCSPSFRYLPCSDYRSEYVTRLEAEGTVRGGQGGECVMRALVGGMSVLFLVVILGFFFKNIKKCCRRVFGRSGRESLIVEEANNGEKRTMVV